MRIVVCFTALLALFLASCMDHANTQTSSAGPIKSFPTSQPPPSPADFGDMVVITSPKDNAKVAETENVDGRLTNRGDSWPVVLVKPDGSLPYYVQDEVSAVHSSGSFAVNAHIGDPRTPQNTNFTIIVIMAPSKTIADELSRKATIEVLDPDWPRSVPVVVHRN